MTAIRRMQALEQKAGRALRERGYMPIIVSHFVRSSRYIAFNLTARRAMEDGTTETLMVKLKITLHPLASLSEAEEFCRDEISSVQKFFNRVSPEEERLRFEIWLAIPLDGFQQFEIRREGIREISLPVVLERAA